MSEWYQLAQESPCLKQTTRHAGPHPVRASYASWPPHASASPASCGPQQPPSPALLRKRAQRSPSTTLPTGCQGTRLRPGNAGAPPPLQPHPGSGNKVQRKKKGDTQAGQRVGAMPAARYLPASSTTEPELTPKPPSSCLLALTTYQHHSERGHHFPRVTQQVHGPAVRFSVGGGLSPRPLHCDTWLPSPLGYSPRSFLGQARFAHLWGFSWVWVRIPVTSLSLFPSP